MSLADLERLLEQTIGVGPDLIGASTIARAVRERQQACSLNDVREYWQLVSMSGAELQALIDAAVVPETWFFRDRKVFTAFTRLVQDDLLAAQPARTLRMLSLPCSTGEEPYSMAMALLDAGVLPGRFQIDGVDISQRSLALARQGIYGKRSFRGQRLEFRDRHFEQTAAGHRISDTVRRQVTFRQGNVISTELFPGAQVYDLILCRNVLIYFSRPMQDRAIGLLSRLLRPDGALFVGHAEVATLQNHGYVQVRGATTAAFRKTGAAPQRAKPAASTIAVRPPPERRATVPQATPPANTALSANTARSANTALPANTTLPASTALPPATNDAGSELDEASGMADQGRLAEAAACCERHIREHGPSARAFYLLGLVRDAAGSRTEAVTFYRKALYLDPYDERTLVHLALLMDKLGQAAQARALRTRMARLPHRQPT